MYHPSLVKKDRRVGFKMVSKQKYQSSPIKMSDVGLFFRSHVLRDSKSKIVDGFLLIKIKIQLTEDVAGEEAYDPWVEDAILRWVHRSSTWTGNQQHLELLVCY
jgi:hypothetical protein